MIKKKSIILFVVLFSLIHEAWGTGNLIGSNPIDTIKLKNQIELADSIKASQPDSGLFYYKKALAIIDKKKESDKRLTYYFSLIHSKLASLYFDLHQLDSAEVHNSIASNSATKINAKEIIGKMLMNKGAIYSYKSEYDSATYFYNKALLLSQEISDQKLEAKIYVNIGIIHIYRGNTDSAFFYFKKPIGIAERLNDKELLGGAYNNLGALSYNTGRLDEAIVNYDKAITIYQEINDSLAIILCENNIANISFSKCDYTTALDLYRSIAQRCVNLNDRMELAKAYHNMGEVYYSIHAYAEATNYYLKSIEIREKLDDKNGMSSDYICIGKVQISNRNPEKALIYYNKALVILTKIDNKAGLTSVYNILGDAYTELNIPDSVVYYLNKAKDLAIKSDNITSLSSTYFNFGKFYKRALNYQEALLSFNKAIRLFDQLEDAGSTGTACCNIANIYNTLGATAQSSSAKRNYLQLARQYAIRAYEISEEKQLLDVKAEAAKELKSVYEALGDLKQAIHFYDVYTIASDSLSKKAQSESAIFAEARWQADKKQNQITFLEQQKKLNDELISVKESENKTQKLVIYLLIVSLVILTAGAIVIAYFVRKQKRLEYQQQLNKISTLKLENARGRVSPHFLFNSLSTIQDELNDKPEVNKRLHAIINMLRCSLLNIEKPSIPLKDEIEFVKNYVLLQQAKFLPDLLAEIDIDSEALYDLMVPAMIVQIPVENAIKHGLAGKSNGDKSLKVEAYKENGALKISIADNGIGRKPGVTTTSQIKGTGTGLKVISQTLNILNRRNDKKIVFSIIDQRNESGENCGTKVDISIPFTFNYNLLN